MAMPLMEGVPARDTESWLKQIVSIVATRPEGLKRTIFELQAVDWRKPSDEPDRRIPTEMLAHQMCLLVHLGAQNFGYYPDDFIKEHPDTVRLHRDFSLQSSRLPPGIASRPCGS
jgi:biofilm PGA synthesis lipoprotein PgaB